MHRFDRLDEHLRQRPFLPVRIHGSSGATWIVATPECLTCDKVNSMTLLLFRDDRDVWIDCTIRGSQIVAIESPSRLH
ncbi:MAG: hypothetical protein FJ257_03415 [Phycisphaerae bacterium]|nr:hypothetical protein [Phycisphaerae bacterium]